MPRCSRSGNITRRAAVHLFRTVHRRYHDHCQTSTACPALRGPEPGQNSAALVDCIAPAPPSAHLAARITGSLSRIDLSRSAAPSVPPRMQHPQREALAPVRQPSDDFPISPSIIADRAISAIAVPQTMFRGPSANASRCRDKPHRRPAVQHHADHRIPAISMCPHSCQGGSPDGTPPKRFIP